MQRKDITRQLDAQGLPDANQRYIIPESFASAFSSFHNRGLYSVWNHFVEFCVNNNRIQAENKLMEMDAFFQVSDYLGNRHIFGTYRLKIFVHLSMTRERDALQLDLRKLDTSFASGVTTRSSGNAALTPLSSATPTGQNPSSAYRFRAISTSTGVQVVENVPQKDARVLLDDPLRPRALTLESIETAQSAGGAGIDDVSLLTDGSFGGQKRDSPGEPDDYFLGDIPDTKGTGPTPVTLRSASSGMRWEPEQGRQQQQWHQHPDPRYPRPFGGFSPPPPMGSTSYSPYHDQGAPAFSPHARPFSPRGGGSYLSPQARPFSPHSPRHQQPPSYGQLQYGVYDRDQPAPYPSQARYQGTQRQQQQPTTPPYPGPGPGTQWEPTPPVVAAAPSTSLGGRYLITPPEPLAAESTARSVPMAAHVAPSVASPKKPSSTLSVGGGYLITPPPDMEPVPLPVLHQYAQQWDQPYANVPLQVTEADFPIEQDWSLVDDATTFANTRANFHLALPAEALTARPAAAFPSPKHTKTVMWADQTTKTDGNASDASEGESSRASTSSISSGSAQGILDAASQFDILQQVAELGSTSRDDWQLPGLPATTPSRTAATSWLQDDEDFRVDLLGAFDSADEDLSSDDYGKGGDDDGEGPFRKASAALPLPTRLFSEDSQDPEYIAPSLLDALPSPVPASALHDLLQPICCVRQSDSHRINGSAGGNQSIRNFDAITQLDTTALPSWLTAGSPFTFTTARDPSLTLDLAAAAAGGAPADGGFPVLTLDSLSLSPIHGSDSGSEVPSGAASPVSPRNKHRFHSAKGPRLTLQG